MYICWLLGSFFYSVTQFFSEFVAGCQYHPVEIFHFPPHRKSAVSIFSEVSYKLLLSTALLFFQGISVLILPKLIERLILAGFMWQFNKSFRRFIIELYNRIISSLMCWEAATFIRSAMGWKGVLDLIISRRHFGRVDKKINTILARQFELCVVSRSIAYDGDKLVSLKTYQDWTWDFDIEYDIFLSLIVLSL